MTFNLSVRRLTEPPLTLTLNLGQTLFVLGANGTGKSALMYTLSATHAGKVRQISAHRQTWFSRGGIIISPADRQQIGENISNQDRTPRSRYVEVYPEQRAFIAIYDLIEAENVRARHIADAVDNHDIQLAQDLSQADAPIKIINELLRLSNIPIVLSVQGDEVVASKSGSSPYNIAKLSDGERNALLIAANVLTAEPGTLILIDEPERHLHRSIISPLLTQVFAKRPDCAFVVSTYDILLPLDNAHSRTILLRSCTFGTGDMVVDWDADLIPENAEIDSDLKKDILGARRKVLFVEGAERSLDQPLYSLVFPNVSVIAKANCRDVEHAVSAIRDAEALHWVHAFGIVDRDARPQAEIDALKEKGVYATSVLSVEAIYYHPEIQSRVAKRHVASIGGSCDDRLVKAKRAALEAIEQHIQRLGERAAQAKVREKFFENLPKKQDIATGKAIDFSIDVAEIVATEVTMLRDAVAAGDILSVIEKYPIRETPALTAVAAELGFKDRAQYEGAVRKLLMDDATALTFVKSLFGSLPADIAS